MTRSCFHHSYQCIKKRETLPSQAKGSLLLTQKKSIHHLHTQDHTHDEKISTLVDNDIGNVEF